jgi:hypothetical protein
MIRKFKQVNPPDGVRDPEVGRRLWELSERLSATSPAFSREAVAVE